MEEQKKENDVLKEIIEKNRIEPKIERLEVYDLDISNDISQPIQQNISNKEAEILHEKIDPKVIKLSKIDDLRIKTLKERQEIYKKNPDIEDSDFDKLMKKKLIESESILKSKKEIHKKKKKPFFNKKEKKKMTIIFLVTITMALIIGFYVWGGVVLYKTDKDQFTAMRDVCFNSGKGLIEKDGLFACAWNLTTTVKSVDNEENHAPMISHVRVTIK